MGDYQFNLRHTEKVRDIPTAKFKAIFPNKDLAGTTLTKVPPFVRIWDGPFEGYFKTRIEKGNGSIFVHPSELEGIADNHTVQYEATSSWKYFIYKIGKDNNERFALIGLCLAVLGVLIDIPLAFAKTTWKADWFVNYSGPITALAFLFKTVGLLLVYVKGVREWK